MNLRRMLLFSWRRGCFGDCFHHTNARGEGKRSGIAFRKVAARQIKKAERRAAQREIDVQFEDWPVWPGE